MESFENNEFETEPEVSAAVPALTCFIMALSLGVFYNLGKEKLKEVYGDKE